MNNNKQVSSQPGMSLGDIYYTIFRHKWKIVITSLMGLLAAAAIYHFKAPMYESQAELLIKYVQESTQSGIGGDNPRMIVPDSGSADVINSEIRILTSLDVAEEAASNIGPATVLAKLGGGDSANRAAALIRLDLLAEPAGSIIVVTLKHPDPQVVQPLLDAVINAYLQKHYEIHSAGGQFEDALTMEQSTLSVQLTAIEQQLADLKDKSGIINLDDSQKALAVQLSRVRDEILEAQAELSGEEAALKEGGAKQFDDLENTNRLPVQVVIPRSQIDAYADLCANLDSYRKKEQEYRTQGFTESNSILQGVEEQIAGNEKLKEALEKKYPQIAGVAPVAGSSGSTTAVAATDPRVQLAEIATLKAKIQAWGIQLAELQTQATNLNNLAPTINQLQQTESTLQANYQTLSASLERYRIDEQLDTGKTPNIRPVQQPSPPARDWKKTYKFMAVAGVGGIFAGLAWAFLIEMVLDRSVRRPVEIERRLKIPLFLSIPNVNRNGYARLARTAERRQLAYDGGVPTDEKGSNFVSPMVASKLNPSLQSFYQALRDRLILYFEVKNFTHKPKLVAVTGASRGAGVSTIACGLAASLSETGDGNVLLIDMNMENGSAQQFYKGKACCGLDTVLTSATKKDALVQENLYVVNGNADGEGLNQAVFPKRFTALVPKLKASEYDYIIFDMPVVSSTSVVSHLARFMDITLLVAESEKTGRDMVEQANAWLTEVGATVGVVLNKTHQYVPKPLRHDLGDK